jgi:hypothetical protein
VLRRRFLVKVQRARLALRSRLRADNEQTGSQLLKSGVITSLRFPFAVPAWRELFRKQSRRLLPEIRRELEPRSVAQERAFIEHLLRDLLETTPESNQSK